MTIQKINLSILTSIICISMNAQDLSFPKDSGNTILKLTESDIQVQKKLNHFQNKSNNYKIIGISGIGLAVLSSAIWSIDFNQNSNSNYSEKGLYCFYGVSIGSTAAIFGLLKHASYLRKYKNLSENPNDYNNLITKKKFSKEQKKSQEFYEYKSQKYTSMRNIGIGTTFAGLGIFAFSTFEFNRLQKSPNINNYPVDLLSSFGMAIGGGITIGGGILTTIGHLKSNQYSSYPTSTMGINKKGEFSFCYNF